MPFNDRNLYTDIWNEDHVLMPCSQHYLSVSYDKSCLSFILFSLHKEKGTAQMADHPSGVVRT
jgi:hypothetical protein